MEVVWTRLWLEASQCNAKLLEEVTLVDTPGVLSGGEGATLIHHSPPPPPPPPRHTHTMQSPRQAHVPL